MVFVDFYFFSCITWNVVIADIAYSFHIAQCILCACADLFSPFATQLLFFHCSFTTPLFISNLRSFFFILKFFFNVWLWYGCLQFYVAQSFFLFCFHLLFCFIPFYCINIIILCYCYDDSIFFYCKVNYNIYSASPFKKIRTAVFEEDWW